MLLAPKANLTVDSIVWYYHRCRPVKGIVFQYPLTPKAPGGFTATLSTNGTNVILSWDPSLGNVSNYVIIRIDSPSYAPVVIVSNISSSATSYTDTSLPSGTGYEYEIEASYGSGASAVSGVVNPNIEPAYTTMGQVVRGPQGALYLAVSAVPQNVVAIRVNLFEGTMEYPLNDYGLSDFQEWTPPIDSTDDWIGYNLYSGPSSHYFDIPVTNFVNGICQIPATNYSQFGGYTFVVQGVGADGRLGSQVIASPLNDWSGILNYAEVYADTAIPFMDGRTNIAQNISFQLRAATAAGMFGEGAFNFTMGSYAQAARSNYVYSGYYFENRNAVYDPVTLLGNWVSGPVRNEFGPFEESSLYHYFAYTPGTFGANGFVTNGLAQQYDNFEIDGTGGLFSAYNYVAATNYSPIAPVLNPTDNAKYILGIIDGFYNPPGTTNYYPDDYGLALEGASFTPSPPVISLTYGFQNIYGLTLQSVEHLIATGPVAYSNTTTSQAFSLPHGVPPYQIDPWYQEYAQPVLGTVAYYFARPGIEPFPGESGFDPTNTTPSPIIIPVGQPFRLTAWAKQVVSNGYSGVYAFPQQYFDKAFKCDTNGNITTNQTGVLSEYGEFFPTEPGKIILTTKPDGATGATGQCVVYAIKMQLDVNHDGVMDLTYAGPDNTSADRPFNFWINDDWDEKDYATDPGYDAENPYSSDMNLLNVHSQRDLEDFARLWVCGLPPLAGSNGFQVSLSWNVLSGAPAIHLVNSIEATGGIGYLTNTNVAAAQAVSYFNQSTFNYYGPGNKFASVPAGQTYGFASNFFSGGTNTFLLFEGGAVGKGELVLTISKGGTNLASTSVFMDLKQVKDMIEHASAENVTAGHPPSSLTSTLHLISNLRADPTEDKQMIVFVHGINNTEFDAENACETMFKRLYWSGYHGRVSAFRWPCAYLPFENTLNPFYYNLGVFYAWKSAAAFMSYLTYLRNNTSRLPGYEINIIAHSQGNVVASEALEQGAPFDNYILTQGAIPAHCYDTDTNHVPFLQKLLDAENGDGKQTPFYATNGGYNGYLTNLTGNLINFFNTNDFALATGTYFGLQANWEEDQRSQKPEAFISGPSYLYQPTNQVSTAYYNFSSYTVTDMQEIKSMVARSRTKAVGAQAGVQKVVGGQLDLGATFNFGNTRPEHSGQFTKPIQTILGYYNAVLIQIQPEP